MPLTDGATAPSAIRLGQSWPLGTADPALAGLNGSRADGLKCTMPFTRHLLVPELTKIFGAHEFFIHAARDDLVFRDHQLEAFPAVLNGVEMLRSRSIGVKVMTFAANAPASAA